MLPVLMENNGSYDQIRSNIYTMLVVSGVVVALLGVLLRAQAQVEELRQQVQELRVEIDQTKRAEQVSEIVESEYFQDLAARAKTLRDRNQ
jgi:cell division protein FtsL